MKKFLMRAALLAALTFGVSQGAFAQWVVFDPTNFAQNVITAAKAVKGEIYQDTNITYQYQMMANQLLQAKDLDPTAMKAQYDQITGDLDKVKSLTSTLTNLYGNLQQGSDWLAHVQTLISRSGKSNAQWFADQATLYNQNDQAVKNMFQMGNDVMNHTQQLAQRRQELQSQLALSPTQEATAALTTHYLDIVTSQNADLLQMNAARAQQDAQKTSVANSHEADKSAAMQSFTAQQDAERAALGVNH
jgi:P-type conjugative transfer protein TrbJ